MPRDHRRPGRRATCRAPPRHLVAAAAWPRATSCRSTRSRSSESSASRVLVPSEDPSSTTTSSRSTSSCACTERECARARSGQRLRVATTTLTSGRITARASRRASRARSRQADREGCRDGDPSTPHGAERRRPRSSQRPVQIPCEPAQHDEVTAPEMLGVEESCPRAYATYRRRSSSGSRQS